MKYNILVLDLDGTLTNAQKVITPHTKEVLFRAQEQGVKIVLASGRPRYGIVPLADELELDKFGGYILAFNGAEIIQWDSKEVLHQVFLEKEFLPYIYKCAQQAGFSILTHKDKWVITDNADDPYVQKEAFINKMPIRQVEDILGAMDFPVVKCLIVGEPERLAVLEQEMYAVLHEKMGVFRSEPYFLELVPHGIDKAQSLALLLEKLGKSKEEMIAIGDGFNDLSMIQLAGLGIAMSNAQEVVRNSADFITLSNEEDGVAYAVEKFMLSSTC